MRYENIELTGSLDISGSFIAPKGASLPSTGKTGDLFFNTTNKLLYEYRAEDGWNNLATQTAYVPGLTLDYLVVAGGGSGGGWGGGAGAGGMLTGSLSEKFTSGSTLSAVIGAGASFNTYGSAGDADYQQGLNGNTSSLSSTSGTSFTTIDTVGGGGGGDYSSGNATAGSDGGSGGGAASKHTNSQYSAAVGGSGTTGQGNDGGDTSPTGDYYPGGGGGGGAGQEGQNGSGNEGGPGGSGSLSSITGTATFYAGGGSGHSSRTDQNPGTPAAPGGGGHGGRYATAAGTVSSIAAGDGTANTGGGGGSSYGYQSYTVGKGGSGVVIVAYTTGSDDDSVQAAGGIKGDDGNGKQYHQFNTSGTLTIASKSELEVDTDNLVGHFDAGDYSSRGTSTWTDLTGTNNGAVSGATLGNNFYYDFDGSNDYVDVGTNPISSGTAYTLMAWINPDVVNIYQHIIDIESNQGHLAILNDGTPYLFNGSTYNTTSTQNVTASTWQLITGVKTTTGIKVYKNLTEVGSVSSSHTTTLNDINIGYWQNSSSRYFNGKIGIVSIYDKSLSVAELTAYYNATKHNFI